MADRAGLAGAQLGRAELEQDVRSLTRVRRLCQRTLEIRPGDVGGAFGAGALRGFA
jgi:hypothetical protein